MIAVRFDLDVDHAAVLRLCSFEFSSTTESAVPPTSANFMASKMLFSRNAGWFLSRTLTCRVEPRRIVCEIRDRRRPNVEGDDRRIVVGRLDESRHELRHGPDDLIGPGLPTAAGRRAEHLRPFAVFDDE